MDSNNNYEERNQTTENYAETICEEHYENKGYLTKMGFNEKKSMIPSEIFWKIPSTIRNIPDYLCVGTKVKFIEVKGFKETLKIKLDDLLAYEFWNNIQFTNLCFFVVDCETNIKYELDYYQLKQLISSDDTITSKYWDNKKVYFEIKKEKLEYYEVK